MANLKISQLTTATVVNTTDLMTIVQAGVNKKITWANVEASLEDTVINGKLLTGYVSSPGIITATDSILSAIQKLNGNAGSFLSTSLASAHIFVGNGSNLATDVAVSGDLSLANTGAFTLATVNANTGSFGSSTSIPTFTVNAKGLITAASGNAVIAPAGTLSGTTLNSSVVSSSLTSVGTITSGTWNGTTIDVTHGGTSLTTLTLNNVILGNGTSAPTFVAPGTSGNVLTSNGTTWTSAPAMSGGTVTSVALTVPAFLSVSGSPITSSGTLAITLSGTALLIANGGTGQTTASAAFNALSPITTTGDLIYSASGATNSRLAIGTAGQILTVSGGIPAWAAPATSGTVTSVALTVPTFLSISGSPVTSSGTLAISLSGTALPIANGGTAATSAASAFNNLSPMTTAGDLIYGGVSGAGTRLPIGSAGQVLTVSGGNPVWAAATSGGTVTSVAATVPGVIFSITGSPITTSGTLAFSLITQTANTLLAGPVSGAVATPTFRALVNADIPIGTGNSFITSGTTYTTPSNINANTVFKFTLIGGGGGGGGIATANKTGAGGGGGGSCIVYLTGLAASTAYTIAIGAAGTAGAATPTDGGAGGNTTISINATTYTASGGSGGSSTPGTNGGAGGSTTNATIGVTGEAGGPSSPGASANDVSGKGGNTLLGFGGAAIVNAGVGLTGTGFGSGGSGGYGNANAGGAGKAGCILVEWGV